MTEQLAAGPGDQSESMRQLAGSQERLAAAVETQVREGGSAIDAESRMRLRSMDVQLLRILEEMSAGRQEALSDLRIELNALTRALSRGDEPPRTPPAMRKGTG